jgi:hypothetical protein
MTANGEQVAALRGYLEQDLDAHERMVSQFPSEAAHTSYGELVGAAFYIAARQWAAAGATFADVVGFVSNLRIQSEELATELHPAIAERLLATGYVDEELDALDDDRTFKIQLLLLLALISYGQLDDATLDQFLAQAQELASSVAEAV